MNDLTKALLQDLQEDLNRIKKLGSNIEVVWQLEGLKRNIEFTHKEIKKNM